MATINGNEIQAALRELNKAANTSRQQYVLFSATNDLQGGYSLQCMTSRTGRELHTVAKGTKRDVMNAINCLARFLNLVDIKRI